MADIWPPKELQQIRTDMQRWDAWYVGDPDKLAGVYAGSTTRTTHTGGIVQRIARFFWSRPETDTTSAARTHVPLAADIASAMGDLLFSSNPSIEGSNEATTARIDDYVDSGLVSALREAVELASVHGGVYLRPSYDTEVSEVPFLQVVRADDVIPTFRHGRLVGAVITTRVADDGSTVLRYRETHLTLQGVGLVRPELLQGTASSLGRPIPLTDHAHTAGLAAAVGEDGFLIERTPGLGLIYLPNLKPQRRWANHPIGKNLGRSDFDGVEPQFDALDEAYSAWLRDIRLGKARIVVPEDYLETSGAGNGATFDTDREVFTPLSIPQPESGSAPITTYQSQMRSAEHQLNVAELTRIAIRSVGLAPRSLGEETEGGLETATAVRFGELSSERTRKSKSRTVIPAVREALVKMLHIDTVVFKTAGLDVTPASLKIDLGVTVTETVAELAQTATMLRAAQAASTKTIVELIHPDWDSKQVETETEAILAEQGSGADPAWV